MKPTNTHADHHLIHRPIAIAGRPYTLWQMLCVEGRPCIVLLAPAEHEASVDLAAEPQQCDAPNLFAWLSAEAHWHIPPAAWPARRIGVITPDADLDPHQEVQFVLAAMDELANVEPDLIREPRPNALPSASEQS